MTPASELRSGKTDRDENFPVASWIIHPRHRALILAFYNFVRTADDIADHALLDAPAKLALLDELEADLLGQGDGQAEAVILREALQMREMPPRHALDVLIAFRMDVTKLRYADWDELIHYCSFSAMPVGRFMLDVHGESKATWPASDALCAALQINNHLQDCGNDYRDLDRVYIPQDTLDRHGASVDDLKQAKASPALLACIRELVARTETLMHESETLTVHIADVRLGCDVAVIETFAWQILKMLKVRDPLSEKVHLSKASMAGYALTGIAGGLWRRATTSAPMPRSTTPGA
ncbi:squalene synthase HpnC [Tardiphaga sp. 841_E9_N1_2]|uniref:squalene synthase HpnC n=1 Tax=Tardiphaga sp. 841_E9_N1_2 TaxID=3240762 RepID=UPI003F266D1A